MTTDYFQRFDELRGRAAPLVEALVPHAERAAAGDTDKAPFRYYLAELDGIKKELASLQPPRAFRKVHRSFERVVAGLDTVSVHIRQYVATGDVEHLYRFDREVVRVKKPALQLAKEIERSNREVLRLARGMYIR